MPRSLVSCLSKPSHRRKVFDAMNYIASMVVMALIYPAPLLAQSIGERVRVTLPDTKLTGLVAERSEVGLGLTLDNKQGGIMHIKYSDLTHLERSLGSRRQVKRGAISGFLVGAALGGIAFYGAGCISLMAGASCVPEQGINRIGFAAFGAAAVGSYVALIGAGIGALIKREQWQSLPIKQEKGAGLSLVLRF